MGRHGPPGLSSSERAELWSRWKAGCHVRQIARAFGRDHGRVRAAYNYADHLPQRKVMMQDWVEYLVRLKEGAVSSWVRAHPATVAPAGSNRSSRGGDEAAEAFGVEGRIGDLANAQAIT